MRKSETTTPPSGSRKPLRLTRFGQVLRAARVDGELGSQQEIAERLGGSRSTSVSQSLVAQLESGRVTNPGSELLAQLASTYKVAYLTLVAAVICDKYRIPPFQASFIERAEHYLDVGGFKKWEKALPNGSTIWLGAPNFIDNTDDEMRSIVVDLLRRDCTFLYFVDRRDMGPGRKFNTLLAEFAEEADLHPNLLRVLPLDEKQVALLSASFVIANPMHAFRSEPQAEGYLVVNDEKGFPNFGIKMSLSEIQHRVDLLTPIVEEHSKESRPPPKIVPIKEGRA